MEEIKPAPVEPVNAESKPATARKSESVAMDVETPASAVAQDRTASHTPAIAAPDDSASTGVPAIKVEDSTSTIAPPAAAPPLSVSVPTDNASSPPMAHSPAAPPLAVLSPPTAAPIPAGVPPSTIPPSPAVSIPPSVAPPPMPKDSSSIDIEERSLSIPRTPAVTTTERGNAVATTTASEDAGPSNTTTSLEPAATVKIPEPEDASAPTTASDNKGGPSNTTTSLDPAVAAHPQQYARNYLILSQIAGGLPEELKLILGDHIEWDQMKYIPHKGRPISELFFSPEGETQLTPPADRRPTISPFTGRSAKYRHPATNIPYSSVAEFKQIQALLTHRYVWSEELGCWLGGEEDVPAHGVADIPGWREAVHGGWFGGKEIAQPTVPEIEEAAPAPAEAVDEAMDVDEPAMELPTSKKKGKRKSTVPEQIPAAKAKSSKKRKKPRQTM